jgi:hypothetical protein
MPRQESPTPIAGASSRDGWSVRPAEPIGNVPARPTIGARTGHVLKRAVLDIFLTCWTSAGPLRGAEDQAGERLCNLRNTILRLTCWREASTFRPESAHNRHFLGQVASGATPRRPLSAGMAGISRKAFHPSTPDDRAHGAGCRDGGPNIALRGAAPRPRTTDRTGRTMGYARLIPVGAALDLDGQDAAGRDFAPSTLAPGGAAHQKTPLRAVAHPATRRKACPPGPAPQQFTQALGGRGAGFRAPTCRVRPLKFRRFSPNQPGIGASDLVRLGAAPRP